MFADVITGTEVGQVDGVKVREDVEIAPAPEYVGTTFGAMAVAPPGGTGGAYDNA